MIYPWQEKTWQALTHAYANIQLPHALLITGIAGIGKLKFTQELVRYILCENKTTPQSCCDSHRCQSCHLIQTSVHPDVHHIKPEKTGHAIKMDQIRDMIETVRQAAYRSIYQCVIIESAEAMNSFAANALLKTLEEPASNIFI